MIPGLHLEFSVSDIHGAEYNPRKIDTDALDRLKLSLAAVGCCKPIIVRGKTIVAGHQRTKALRAMGVTTAPVFLLQEDANLRDEIRFNQLHNGTDMDRGDENVFIKLPEGAVGYVVATKEEIAGNSVASGAVIRNEIMRLITAYGPWGACVAKPNGEVIHAAQYALACKATSNPLLVYVLKPEQVDAALKYLNSSYGQFCYDNLPRNTFIQTFAQLPRLRSDGDEDVSDKNSPTYENHIIPWLEKNRNARVLDFGCGQGDYVKHLQTLGYRIIGMELFRRVKGSDSIDIKAVNLMADALCRELTKRGRFDAVVMDYVLNSVDSVEAESDVMKTICAFCKSGGTLFFSGRPLEHVLANLNNKSCNAKARGVEFIDKDGLTALYRKGQWFYQKFHSKEDIAKLAATHNITIVKQTETVTGWQVHGTNAESMALPAESLSREFNMKVGVSGRTLNRHDDVIAALEVAFEKSQLSVT